MTNHNSAIQETALAGLFQLVERMSPSLAISDMLRRHKRSVAFGAKPTSSRLAALGNMRANGTDVRPNWNEPYSTGRVGYNRRRSSLSVRFAPKATTLLRRRTMSRRATSRHESTFAFI